MIIDGKNFFPLTHINTNLVGYFLGLDDHIYSNRSATNSRDKLRALAGTKPYGTNQTYFTLAGNSYKKDVILSHAKAHPKYYSEMTTNAAPITPPAPVAAQQAMQFTAGIANQGTIIGSVENGQLSISPTPRFHTDLASLRTEMERLAKLNPGKQFVSLKVTGSVVAGGLNWT